MKVLAIIQARLDSQRLPNKVLLQIPPESGISMLEMVIRKVMLAKLVDRIVVTTPDEKIAHFVDDLYRNIYCYLKDFGGRDVLREYYEIAKRENWINLPEEIYAIVRITADCPLIKPEEIDRCVDTFLKSSVDLVYNTDERNGQLNGEGSDVEVFSYEVLKLAYKKAECKDEREHVTLWMRRNCQNLKSLYSPCKKLGILSVNTYEDYKKVCEIVKNS